MARYVQIVNSNGNVNYNDCNWNDYGVRPFWGEKCRKVRIYILKSESHHQKSKYPFLPQDKNKGIQKMEHYSFESVSNFEALYKAYRKSRKGSGHKKSKI